MSDFLKKIILPQLKFIDNTDQSEKFLKVFLNLYRIELFKDGIDLILTKLKQQELRLEVREIRGWDTNVGCFLSEESSVFDKVLGKFVTKKTLKIILRNLHYNVLAHEMAHALEHESGINLGEQFRQAIAYDMNGRKAEIMTLRGEIERLMVRDLKSYKPQQFLSEFFARYFELLSISRNVMVRGDFATSDVMEFFENTTNFLEKIFNPQIRKRIDPEIAKVTIEIARQVRLVEPEQKFQDRIESIHKSPEKIWSKSIKSNASWQKSWEATKNLDDKKS